MEVNAITVNAAGLAQGWGIQANMPKVQTEKSGFGPVCRVTISQEGKELSRQQTTRQAEKRAQSTQNVETEKTQSSHQEGTDKLHETLTESFQSAGFTGEEDIDRVKRLYYEDIYRRTQGGIQPIPYEDPTEEEIAAMNERARQSKENLEKILKSLTPADFANATPLKFDYVAKLSDTTENESWQ